MKTILKILENTYQSVVSYHNSHSAERVSFLTGSLVKGKDRQMILVSGEPIFLAEDCYETTTRSYLRLYPDVAAPLMQHFVEGFDPVLINIHHHPFSESGTGFSAVDDEDDIRMDKVLRSIRDEMGLPFINVSMVLDQNSFDARITDTSSTQVFTSIDQVQCIGSDRFHIRYPNSVQPQQLLTDEISCRQNFIDPPIQHWLKHAHIGICGAGGTGSITAEALLRYNCGHITIVDDDVVETSNLNRLQGVGYQDVGQHKVKALRRHLKRLSPKTHLTTVHSAIHEQKAFDALMQCDVVFSTVDNAYARAALNQLSVQGMIPLFDVGVEVALEPTNFLYRVFNVLPGASACMMCSQFEMVDMNQVNRASLSAELEAEYRARGYITGVEQAKAASVYGLNLMAVGAMMTDFLNYLCGFRDMTVLRYSNFQERRLETTEQQDYPANKPAADCPVCSSYLGRGYDLPTPYLNKTEHQQKSVQQLFLENSNIFS
ncbi:HesA/MoeB/ThiF family protein [Ketobacter sp.]|uniref:HesA/MoeB/ThiF family protein n=1 Tax=Ketobacter sp. TaxID=2083498 RepID=UPI000F0E8502|nr:ThiF family adenylyltransferase [Ketobacter sp.]RLU01753.1 MAG: ThiF family adenylyltransferase [Ketobacter sp.]